jgi:hypothetical protein
MPALATGAAARGGMEKLDSEGFLSLRRLAVYSGLSVRTLRDLIHRSVAPLPYYQIANKILVRRSEFDTWMCQFRRCREIVGDRCELDRLVDEVVGSLTARDGRTQNRAYAATEG